MVHFRRKDLLQLLHSGIRSKLLCTSTNMVSFDGLIACMCFFKFVCVFSLLVVPFLQVLSYKQKWNSHSYFRCIDKCESAFKLAKNGYGHRFKGYHSLKSRRKWYLFTFGTEINRNHFVHDTWLHELFLFCVGQNCTKLSPEVISKVNSVR